MSISLTSLSYNSSSNNSGAQALDLGSLGKVLVDTAATAMALSFLKGIDGLFERGGQNVFHHGCGCSCDPDLNTLPAPDPMFSSAPAGKGLETSPEGWPPGAVKTAGGYVIVAEGSCNWSIYAPGQKCGDTPMTRVHGDPHVSEKDGTRWDFTKDSDFVLPDGTRIFCNTSSETGQSVTTGLTITNGADRVEISGVNGHPQVGEVTRDGYEWRAAHNQQHLDSYYLGGNGNDKVSWFKVGSDGMSQGEVTGARFDNNTHRYEQITDGNKQYWVDPKLQPEIGTEAWGNEMRSRFIDVLDDIGVPADWAQSIAGKVHLDHSINELRGMFAKIFQSFLPADMFSGFASAVSNDGQKALSDLRDEARKINLFNFSFQYAALSINA